MKYNSFSNLPYNNNLFPNENQAEFLINFENCAENFSDSEIKSLNDLVRYSNLFQKVNPSQGTIAKTIGVSSKTVWRSSEKFVKNNILIKVNKVWQTCTYILNPMFFDFKFRKRFQHILKNLNFFPRHLLLSVQISTLAFNNYSQCEYVQPYINNINIKEEELPKVNTSTYFREGYTNVRNNKDVKTYTNRKGVVLDSDKSNKESVMLEKIKKEWGLGNYEIEQLGAFSNKILEEGYKVISRKKGVVNKFRFFLGICKNIEARLPNKPVPTTPKKQESIFNKNVEEKKYTAVEMATEILNSLKMQNNAPMLIPAEVHEKIKQRNIHNLLNENTPVLTGEPGEDVALLLIEDWRTKLFIPISVKALKPSQNLQSSLDGILSVIKSQSSQLNENHSGNTIIPKDEKNLIEIEIESDTELLEEVYD